MSVAPIILIEGDVTMVSERTKEDREHIDEEPTTEKELKELMPDEAAAIDRAEEKTRGRESPAAESKTRSRK